MKLTSGDWVIIKERLNKLPAFHVVTEVPSNYGKVTYICSVHETTVRGEDKANANLLAAAKDMYEAIVIGLTGKDLAGNVIEQDVAMQKLVDARNKAEGKEPSKTEPEKKGKNR